MIRLSASRSSSISTGEPRRARAPNSVSSSLFFAARFASSMPSVEPA